MSLSVAGISQCRAKMEELGNKTSMKYTRAAARAGLKPVLAQARSNIHSRSGVTARALKIRAGKGQKGVVSAKVTFDSKLFAGKKGFYGAFEDQGHFTGRRIAKLARSAGKGAYAAISKSAGRRFVQGTHFLERAFDSQKSAAVDAFTEKMKSQIFGGGQ